jgi:hypothetical protein
MVDLHWASARSDVAAELFRRYMRLSWLSRAEHARPLTATESDEVAQLCEQFGPWGSRGWTNRTIMQRVDDIADMWPGEADVLRRYRQVVLREG